MNEVDISKNITEYRKIKGLTIKDLAKLTGVTSSLLSQIEKGTANPSMNTLKKIATALEIPLFNFFINDNLTEDIVVRKNNRRKIMLAKEDSFAYELLTPNSQGAISFMIMKIPARKFSSKELFSHKGEEVAYVMKGSVNLYLMNSVIELNCGDSVKILPHSNHKWENNTDEDCEIIFAITPQVF
ncbi:MAG: helix-turn-helix domain-containing protein [Romboutsia sp.]|uniref:helix-turn-helix domain-containing protein n=1 Tax=Romboutsia sp. TaxID=1965302 RepID=UPI003F401050